MQFRTMSSGSENNERDGLKFFSSISDGSDTEFIAAAVAKVGDVL